MVILNMNHNRHIVNIVIQLRTITSVYIYLDFEADKRVNDLDKEDLKKSTFQNHNRSVSYWMIINKEWN